MGRAAQPPAINRTAWRCAAFRMERHDACGTGHDTGQVGLGNHVSYRPGAEMAGESISLDDLIAQQEQPGLPSIIEAVTDRPDQVRVTPYALGAGPLRSFAFVLPKDAVDSVITTEESYTCCGKKLPVVETTFADPILNDVLQQLSRAFPRDMPRRVPRAAGMAAASPRRPRPRTDPFVCDYLYQDCVGYCLGEHEYGTPGFYKCEADCGQGYLECMGMNS
jgi:hypothetical protein